jgi:hypothetical protein
MNAALLELYCRAQALISEREGMVSLNAERISDGGTLAYSVEHFRENADDFKALADRCKELEAK